MVTSNMYTSSIASTRSMAAHLRELAHIPNGKAAISIHINKDHHSLEASRSDDENAPSQPFVHSYTSLDRIEGEVAITAPHALRFEDISITFEGCAKTFVENMTSSSVVNTRTSAYHNFLKLIQPLDESSLPHPRVLEAGRTYRFPFTFVIPEKLLPTSCKHKKGSADLQDAHLELPPSTGDPELAGDGTQLLDDQSPEMTRVTYAIKAKISSIRESDGKNVVLSERQKKVRVVPAVEEHPPLIGSRLDDYVMCKSKPVKKGFLKGRAGHLTVEAAQPRSLHLPARGMTADACPTTTMATIQLRFDPVDDHIQPPALGQLDSKLYAESYFSSVAMQTFPSKSSVAQLTTRGRYFETLPLASRCVASVQWERCSSLDDAENRRYSAISTMSASDIPAPSESYNGNTFYVAKVLVPITLPKHRAFIPTHYSCIIARFYTLELSLSYHTAAKSVSTPSITIKVPIQISAAGDPAAQQAFSEANAQDMVALEVDDGAGGIFEPGAQISAPSPQYSSVSLVVSSGTPAVTDARQADCAPPEYSEFRSPVVFANEKMVPVA